LFSSFCTTYGYLINDLGDKELDELHAKDNTFKEDSNIKSCLIVFLFLLLSVIFSSPFSVNPIFLLFFFIWICIATAYSIKPFRLKERGKTGLVFVVIAQRVLPILIVFSAFNHLNFLDCLVLTMYIFFRGLSSDVNHQLEDYHKDAKTDTGTYAVQAGLKKTQKIFRFSLELEKGLLILCLSLIMMKLFHVKFGSVPVILPIFLFYLFLYGWSLIAILFCENRQNVNPFIEGKRNIFQFIHHTFPSVILPLYFLLILTKENYWFSVIIFFIILIRRMYSLDLILHSFPVRILQEIRSR
jgi:4-hydroxybenzoate polyprenyltransferase